MTNSGGWQCWKRNNNNNNNNTACDKVKWNGDLRCSAHVEYVTPTRSRWFVYKSLSSNKPAAKGVARSVTTAKTAAGRALTRACPR